VIVERALAQVDVGAVERNCAALRSRLSGGAELCAVVKADGYGHGAVACARAALAGGAGWLAVATAVEAAELRTAGIPGRLLVMGALTPGDVEVAAGADADVVAWRREILATIAAAARGGRARVHVKLDSGMGRLGTADAGELLAIAEAVEADERLELAGLMTHFATADEPGDGHFPAQLARFEPVAAEMRSRNPAITVHAANSAATIREAAAHFDLVRCGIAIYGLDPFGDDATARGLEPALSLHSYVAAVKPFEPGDSAGYGRSWRAPAPTNVGVLPIGYGDGWRRALSNDCDVLIDGRRHPLVGTVSMDNLTVDLGPETSVAPGAPAVLIGRQGSEQITAEEVARRLGTINYEITCGLSQRVRRAHVGGAP
jgi:alanine racemase